jgi:hypothetical protein
MQWCKYVRCGRSLTRSPTHSLTHLPALDLQRARRYGTQRLARGLTCVRLASSLWTPTGRMQRRATLVFAIRPHDRSVRTRVRVCATVACGQSVMSVVCIRKLRDGSDHLWCGGRCCLGTMRAYSVTSLEASHRQQVGTALKGRLCALCP